MCGLFNSILYISERAGKCQEKATGEYARLLTFHLYLQIFVNCLWDQEGVEDSVQLSTKGT